MKAIVTNIEFFDAFFKVHFTKTTRLTYPMPLPTSVAGIFGAMLGWEREEILEKADGFLFGSKLLGLKGTTTEQATFFQMPVNRRGVAPLSLLHEPSYLIAMAGEGKRILEQFNHLKKGPRFLPYGGENDFFIKNMGEIKIKEVKSSKEVENYAPADFVEKVDLLKGASIYTLPVSHSLEGIGDIFYFVCKGGKLILLKELPCTEGIALYPLKNFVWMRG